MLDTFWMQKPSFFVTGDLVESLLVANVPLSNAAPRPWRLLSLVCPKIIIPDSK